MLHPATFAQFARLPSRRGQRRLPSADNSPVLIRPASVRDERAIADLAALEELPALPAGDRLIGELGGRVVAALDVRSGRAVADPFAPTRAIVELLGLRAMQVRR